jgi:rod shape-determining protein MreD
MKPTLWQRLDVIARKLTPFALTFVLIVLSVVPTHLPGYARVAPMLAVMAIYHWTLYRPELLPAVALFFLGLLQDSLSGTPLGVNVLVFLTVYGVVLSQRRFFAGKSFLVTWLGFVLVAAGAAAESWILVSAFHVTLIEPTAVLYGYAVTAGSFPLLAWIFIRWQQAFLRFE